MSSDPKIPSMRSKEDAFKREAAAAKSDITKEEGIIHHLQDELKRDEVILLDKKVKLHQAEEGARLMEDAIQTEEKAFEAQEKLKKEHI